MKHTAESVLFEIAAALDVEAPEKATLGDLRLQILSAIDKLAFEGECVQKDRNRLLKKYKRWRAHTMAGIRYDTGHLKLN